MSIEQYLEKQVPERAKLLRDIHAIILKADKKAVADMGKMMGAEMIIYKTGGVFNYGLASMKDYMSLHAMPIYGLPKLHEKYRLLLPEANFQKGCINFKDANAMPLKVVKSLMEDCAKIDMVALMEEARKARKKK